MQQEFTLETKKIIEPTISIENEFASINKNNETKTPLDSNKKSFDNDTFLGKK